jgi:hypothetical protein
VRTRQNILVRAAPAECSGDGKRRRPAGGLLEKAIGHRPPTSRTAAQDETYLSWLSDDEFGQRVRMVLGNGVVSTYAYEPLTRRLHHVGTTTPLKRTLQDITYSYDRVGNVLGLMNDLGQPVNGQSGAVKFQYRYDDLYRLTWAHGEAKSRPHTVDQFTSTFHYSDIHNMDVNRQIHEVVHGDGSGADYPPKTNHDFTYTYDPAHPHQATKIGDTFLVYDLNGNTVRECRDQGDPSCQSTSDKLWRYSWTEENRLAEAIHGGGRDITKFLYDAAGERVVKLGRGGESITIGQFWSLKGRRAATKHIFAGAPGSSRRSCHRRAGTTRRAGPPPERPSGAAYPTPMAATRRTTSRRSAPCCPAAIRS